MQKRNVTVNKGCLLLSLIFILSGCDAQLEADEVKPNPTASAPALESHIDGMPFDYNVNPKDFSLSVVVGEDILTISNPFENREYINLQETGKEISWIYPNEEITVTVKPIDDYLSVSITSETAADNRFIWPAVSALKYYLPLGEGKVVPSDDKIWEKYLSGQELSVLEQLSMPFFATVLDDYAILYVMEDPYRTHINFAAQGDLSFEVDHVYPQIDTQKENKYRIYITENNPVTVAMLFRDFVMENESFITLEQKAETIPNIRKLYGAPFIYLWGNFIVSGEDVNWQAFRNSLDSPVMQYLLTFSDTLENGKQFQTTLDELKKQDYVGVYQRNVICDYISKLLQRNDFADFDLFTQTNPSIDALVKKGVNNLNESEKIQLNKNILAASLPNVFKDVSTWMNSDTLDLISELKKSGIDNAWIGLHGWEQAFSKPEMIEAAIEQGYLIASYDSYHSIHEFGKEQWSTAQFEDATLYEQATVTDKNGKKIGGFQNVGRKLNPTLTLPLVKNRLKSIVDGNQLPFNSWFVDCDATGEVYDDYTPEHITTQRQDLLARLERIAYIGDAYHMVVGSEGGNDFAASTIAFAHGIELKSFSWIDEDMKQNKDSEYFIGKYYSSSGGVAEHFSKRIPIKSNYYTVFVDPRYDIPLFKMVYNDSVITSYHWDWSTFKIQGATQERMLREILYNVPPLYHLDATEWNRYKDDIVRHTSVWSEFSKQVTTLELTDFLSLEQDGSVQMTEYGDNIRVIANYNDFSYQHENQNIPGKSVLFDINGDTSIYTPEVSPDNE